MDKSWGLDTFWTYYGHVLPKCVQKVSVPTSCTSTALFVSPIPSGGIAFCPPWRRERNGSSFHIASPSNNNCNKNLSSTLQKVLCQICPADLSCSDCHVGWPLAWPLVNCNCAQIYDGGGPERKWPCEIWFCFIMKAKSKCLKPWCFITQNYTIHQDISLRGMNTVVNI